MPNLRQAPASTEKVRPASKGRTVEGTGGQARRGFSARERDHWKFKDRDEVKNRSFVMSHDKIEPMIWERFQKSRAMQRS